jgi:hypothetical protein
VRLDEVANVLDSGRDQVLHVGDFLNRQCTEGPFEVGSGLFDCEKEQLVWSLAAASSRGCLATG